MAPNRDVWTRRGRRGHAGETPPVQKNDTFTIGGTWPPSVHSGPLQAQKARRTGKGYRKRGGKKDTHDSVRLAASHQTIHTEPSSQADAGCWMYETKMTEHAREEPEGHHPVCTRHGHQHSQLGHHAETSVGEPCPLGKLNPMDPSSFSLFLEPPLRSCRCRGHE